MKTARQASVNGLMIDRRAHQPRLVLTLWQLILGSSLLVTATEGCQQVDSATSSLGNTVSIAPQELVVAPHGKWSNDEIPICIVNRGNTGVADIAALARAAVIREFEAKTVLTFNGWDQDCSQVPSSTLSIRLEVTTGSITCGDTNPRYIGCSSVGPTTATLPNSNGATVIVKVDSYASNSWTNAQTTEFQDRIIHELLHGIGSFHEHARLDSTAAESCRKLYDVETDTRTSSSGAAYIGSYDPQSVSNYCSSRQATLTSTDVEGVNALYSGRWVSAVNSVPVNAVPGGTIAGNATYVCRTVVAGGGQYNDHVGKLYNDSGRWSCFIGNGGTEQRLDTYEVLTGGTSHRYYWSGSTSSIPLPSNSVLGGGVVGVGPIYVCRATQSSNTHPGKLVNISGAWSCFIGNGGVEQQFDTYEVLRRDTSARWVSADGTLPAGSIPSGVIAGTTTYPCQIREMGGGTMNTHTGKLYPLGGTWICYIGNGGTEQAFTSYRALVGESNQFTWSSMTSASQLPADSVFGGWVIGVGDCYVCRATLAGNQHPGKLCVVSGGWSCLIGNGGSEQKYDNYEVMRSTKTLIPVSY
ncbi:MAG TPA: DM9 repeat-containing protein [Polyangiaceae bacterium]